MVLREPRPRLAICLPLAERTSAGKSPPAGKRATQFDLAELACSMGKASPVASCATADCLSGEVFPFRGENKSGTCPASRGFVSFTSRLEMKLLQQTSASGPTPCLYNSEAQGGSAVAGASSCRRAVPVHYRAEKRVGFTSSASREVRVFSEKRRACTLLRGTTVPDVLE